MSTTRKLQYYSADKLRRPNYIMLQRFVPHSAQKTTMHYQIFCSKNASDKLFKLINELYYQVMSEDKALCAGAHKNLARGVFVNGQMHPRLESASLHFQSRTRDIVKAHAKREKSAGRQIWPARQAQNDDPVSKEDEEFCAGLACQEGSQQVLAW